MDRPDQRGGDRRAGPRPAGAPALLLGAAAHRTPGGRRPQRDRHRAGGQALDGAPGGQRQQPVGAPPQHHRLSVAQRQPDHVVQAGVPQQGAGLRPLVVLGVDGGRRPAPVLQGQLSRSTAVVAWFSATVEGRPKASLALTTKASSTPSSCRGPVPGSAPAGASSSAASSGLVHRRTRCVVQDSATGVVDGVRWGSASVTQRSGTTTGTCGAARRWGKGWVFALMATTPGFQASLERDRFDRRGCGGPGLPRRAPVAVPVAARPLRGVVAATLDLPQAGRRGRVPAKPAPAPTVIRQPSEASSARSWAFSSASESRTCSMVSPIRIP